MSEGNNASFFDFIEDIKLRTELDNELGFVVFIANCSIENTELSSEKSGLSLELAELMIQKDILIKLGCITEAVLFYTAKRIQLKSSELKGKKLSDKKVVYQLSCGTKRIVTQMEEDIYLDPNVIEFRSVIEALSRLGGFPEGMKDILHRMRKMKNGVHIQDFLMDSDDFKDHTIMQGTQDLVRIIEYSKSLLSQY